MGHSELNRAVLVNEDRDLVEFPEFVSQIGRKELRRSITSVAEAKMLETAVRASGLDVLSINVSELPQHLRNIETRDSNSGDIYWNVTDGDLIFRGAHLPALASLYGFPYFGSSAYVRGIATRKHHWKALVSDSGLPVPSHLVVRSSIQLSDIECSELTPPFFIKPAQYGNSAGIALINPVAKTHKDALKATNTLLEHGLGPVLIEPMLYGEELAVAAVHLDNWRFATFKKSYPGDHLTPAVKDGDRTHEFDAVAVEDPAAIEIAERLIDVVGLKDIFRLDLRRDREGALKLIDINAGCYLIGSVIRDFLAAQTTSFQASLRACLEESYRRQKIESQQ